jgi:hypothetical protein
MHHPETIAEQAAETERLIAKNRTYLAQRDGRISDIEKAILLLIDHGYRVEKIIHESAATCQPDEPSSKGN